MRSLLPVLLLAATAPTPSAPPSIPDELPAGRRPVEDLGLLDLRAVSRCAPAPVLRLSSPGTRQRKRRRDARRAGRGRR